MITSINKKRFQPGFTLVEVLMSLILFSLMFFFTIQFFKMAYSHDLIKDDIPVRLAINEMNEVISKKDFQPDVCKDVRHWRIKSSTKINDNLVFIKVEIFTPRGNKSVYHLETYRVID